MNRMAKKWDWRGFVRRLLIVVPPILFLVYAGHSLVTIRELLSESSVFHINYANNMIQDYFELAIALEMESQRRCLAEGNDLCPDRVWLATEVNGPLMQRLERVEGEPIDLYLKPDKTLADEVPRFIQGKEGLKALFEKRGHDPVYWFRILGADGNLIYASGQEPDEAKARGQYPMARSLKGHTLDIIYNSFGAKKLYSVAQTRINFGVIFLLFLAFVFSIFLFMHSIRNKLFLAKQKTFFVTTVSHEFKTPLAVMRLAAETLENKRFHNPEEEMRFLRMMVNEINRLDQLVRKVLNFNKIGMGQIQLYNQETPIEDVLRPSIEAFKIRAKASGFEFEVAPASDPCPVFVDSGLLRQAIDNILDNAFKYSGDSKRVEMGWTCLEGNVRLWVRDYGVGIPKDEIRHIVKSFYRIDDPKTRGIRGSGLGLSVSHYLLKKMGIKMEVDSIPGEGSTFTLVIELYKRS